MEKMNLFYHQYLWIFIALIIWSLVWKGIALWKSARNKQLIWFIALLILNTLGILEIIYIFLFASKHDFSKEYDLNLNNASSRKKII